MLKLFHKRHASVPFSAVIISRVLDPTVVIMLTLLLTVWYQLVNGERLRFLILLAIVDGVLPAFVLYYFIQRGRVLSGWDVTDRKERVPLFVFVSIAHFIGVLLAYFFGKHPLAEYLTSFWLLTIVYAMITTRWKISVHCGVMSAMITFMVLTWGPFYALGYLLVLLLIWARVIGRYHRLGQALAGSAVPIILMPLIFWWYQLI